MSEDNIGLLYRDGGTCWNGFKPRVFFGKSIDTMSDIEDCNVDAYFERCSRQCSDRLFANSESIPMKCGRDYGEYSTYNGTGEVFKPISLRMHCKEYLARVVGHSDKPYLISSDCYCSRGGNVTRYLFPVLVKYKEVVDEQ